MSDLKIVWFLRVSGSLRKFFGQKSDLNMQFGCRAQKLMHYSGFRFLAGFPGLIQSEVEIGAFILDSGL